MNIEPNKWSDAENRVLSLENIRSLYLPESDYQISLNKYPPNAEFSGWSRKKRLYLISGDCRISVVGNSWSLTGGDFLDLPEGEYSFSVLSNSPVEIVCVWEL